MSILARFSIRGYLPKLIAAFFVVWFAFIIWYLWLYIDDYIGKGLDAWTILNTLGLQTLPLVPIALPLSVLFSSIIYFGELGETSELTALKSSGISLVRFLKPLFLFVGLLAVGSFFFNDRIIPQAQLKAVKTYYEVSNKKPALNIKEGEFYTEIPKHVIYVKKKESDNSTIHGVKIYDNSDGYEQQKVILAKKGKMFVTDDNAALIFELYDGWRYEEVYKPADEKNEQIRLGFKYFKKVFDLKEFDLQKTSEDYFKNMRRAMSVERISKEIDTARLKLDNSADYITQILSTYISKSDSLIRVDSTQLKADLSLREWIDNDSLYAKAATTAEINARSVKNAVEINIQNRKLHIKNLADHKIEWHRRFTIPFACLLLFVIGSSLGAIIRKGGLGMPFIVAVIFFAILHILNTIGEKMASNQILEPWQGMWMSSIILGALALYLLRKANRDDVVASRQWLYSVLKALSLLLVFVSPIYLLYRKIIKDDEQQIK